MERVQGYYLIWNGSLNFGDTPGVFGNAQFAGLIAQIPITITTIPNTGEDIYFLLQTTDVEIFNQKKHPIFWNWQAGQELSKPVGFIDDEDTIPDKPEYHKITLSSFDTKVGKHTLTILLNPTVDAGMKDDFVLKKILASENFGAKIGW